MSDSEQTLAELRRQIDAIDDQIHDLLMRRTEVVETVREVKRDHRIKIRPAREAEIIYRLLDRHHGPFPKRELTRIWRELIVATLGFEGPFSVAVCMVTENSGLWDLARDQYGCFVPMTGFASVRQVIDAVGRQDSVVGVLPLPRRGDPDPWWRHLATEREDVPKVIARLPFAGPGNARGDSPEALVVCPVRHEPTGHDRTLFVVEMEGRPTPARLEKAFGETGHPAAYLDGWQDSHASGAWYGLMEVKGFVTSDQPAFAVVRETLGDALHHVFSVGGYAEPLTPDMLATEVKTPSADGSGQ